MRSAIVIPTYNRAHHLPQAVESALAQVQHDVLVVVVDDGSSDATRQVVARWFDHPRFVYVALGANTGTAGAKNVGLALTPCDAISFHDSDDIPHRDKILRQQRILTRTDLGADPCLPWHLASKQAPGGAAAIDVVLTAHRFVMADGSSARIARTLSLLDDFFPNLQFGSGPLGDWVLVNSGLFRRSLFDRIGGFRDSVEEDRDLRNRALMAGANIWFIDDVLLDKYEQDDSLTAHAATGYRSERREGDRAAVWETIARWKSGGGWEAVPIDLPDVGFAFVSAPERLAVQDALPMTDTTRAWLTQALAAA